MKKVERFLLKVSGRLYASTLYLNKVSDTLVHQNDDYQNCRQYKTRVAAVKGKTEHETYMGIEFTIVKRLVMDTSVGPLHGTAKEWDERDHERFNRIGKAMGKELWNAKKIFLDEFKGTDGHEHLYIVVQFKGGAISVKNAEANSLTANITEMASMLNGGYYGEVDGYLKLKGKGHGGKKL